MRKMHRKEKSPRIRRLTCVYYSNFLSICKHENRKFAYYFAYNLSKIQVSNCLFLDFPLKKRNRSAVKKRFCFVNFSTDFKNPFIFFLHTRIRRNRRCIAGIGCCRRISGAIATGAAVAGIGYCRMGYRLLGCCSGSLGCRFSRSSLFCSCMRRCNRRCLPCLPLLFERGWSCRNVVS